MDESSTPLISICIANYNGEELIGDCLDSVLMQDCKVPIEILVHDDASTDLSVEVINKNYPNVILIRSSNNVGFCVSNNRMAALARGTYLLLLNNDAMLYKNSLKALLYHAEKLGRPCILGLPQYDMVTGLRIDRGNLFDPFLNPVPNTKPDRHDVGMVSGACLWIPKIMWDEFGGFPEHFFYIAEDTYICCMARLWGFPVQVVNNSGFNHWIGKNIGGGRVDSGKLSTTYKRRYHSERNKSIVMFTCYPILLLLVLFPLHIIMLLVEGASLSLLKRDVTAWKKVYAPSIAYLWCNKKRLIADRSRAQKRRVASVREFLAPFVWYPHKLRLILSYGIPDIQ